jgi:hypothetical protein
MPITEHPLHRSVRAHLMHTAPTLGDDAHSPQRIRVMQLWLRKPPIYDWFHFLPSQFAAVASASQGFPPHLSYNKTKHFQSNLIVGHAVIPVVSLNNAFQPLALIHNWIAHAPSQILFDFLKLSSHLLSNRSSQDRVHAVAALYPNDVSKTQEAKRLWFTLLSTLSIVDGPWAKLQNPRLFWMKLKTKLVHSFNSAR